MTIRRGQPWGTAVERPGDLTIAADDAAVAAANPTVPVGVASGDLYRALGSPPVRTAAQQLPIDLLDVTVSDASGRRADFVAAAHVVVVPAASRWRWWRGELVAICNTDYVAGWNVAPRAHPNDGRFDIVTVDASMGLRARGQAWRRVTLGTHVPHPAIGVRVATTVEWSWPTPRTVLVDGVDTGRHTAIAVTIRPDARTVIV